jgi:hypothetical protein
MEPQHFDHLARDVAGGPNRRNILRSLLGMAGLGLLPHGAAAQPGKSTICHRTGNGYNVITVANPSLNAHYRHGDFAYTNCCTDDSCPGDQFCDSGTCARPCPPYYALIDGACRHPCPEPACFCPGQETQATACVANYDGEALCAVSAGHSTGSLQCQTDQDCQDAFGGWNETTGPNDMTYVCNRGAPDGGMVCYGDPTYCTGEWEPVPL